MPFAAVNGIDLYHEVHGDGPALVFAHGSGGNHLSWWQQVPFFSQHYTCVIFDHRSFGSSRDSVEPQGRRAFADDLKGLLDHLGMERVGIVAHSMGGRTGVGFTLRYPERVWCLVLSGSNGGSVTDESRRIRAERHERDEAMPRDTPRGLSPAFIAQQPEKAFLYRQIMRLNPKHDADFLAVPADYRGSTHERLAETGVPILYIVGEGDEVSLPRTIEIAASQVPGSQLAQIPEAGHSTYFEKPGLFNELVMGFLRRHDPSAQER